MPDLHNTSEVMLLHNIIIMFFQLPVLPLQRYIDGSARIQSGSTDFAQLRKLGTCTV